MSILETKETSFERLYYKVYRFVVFVFTAQALPPIRNSTVTPMSKLNKFHLYLQSFIRVSRSVNNILIICLECYLNIYLNII